MTFALAPQFTQREYRWTAWKVMQALKSLVTQYNDDGLIYTIWGYDGPDVHFCLIYKTTVPDAVIAAGYSQVQNDADKADFVANYQTNANQRILLPTPTPLSLLGYATIATTSFAAIRGTTYTEPASGAQRSVVSSSASDSAAGTGARTVRLTYFDNTMAGPFTEDIVLNGVSAVNTVATTIRFIESLIVLTAGASLANEGTVSLMSTTGGGGTPVGSIAPGDNQTQWAHHYVASNKKAFVTGLTGSIRGAYSGELHLRRATPTTASSVEQTISPIVRLAPGVQGDDEYNDNPIVVSGPARLVLYGKASNATSQDWQAGMSLYEVS